MSDPSSSSAQQQPIIVPMYESLARINVEEYVTTKLSDTEGSSNYLSWKLQMKKLIQRHNLVGFIDGTILVPQNRPSNEKGEDFDTWMTDKVVMGWISDTISEPTLTMWMAQCHTASDAWLAVNMVLGEESESTGDIIEATTMPRHQFLGGLKVEKYVTVKLISGTKESSNYSKWKQQMENLIRKHELFGYIDGSIQPPLNRPPAGDGDKDYDTWMIDKVVKWWFDCTISEPSLVALVAGCGTAREAWVALETTFEEKDLSTYEWLDVINVGNFVTKKLSNSKNYSSWKKQMQSLIKMHQLDGFIDGSINPPKNQPSKTTSAYEIWRIDKVVKGWILSTISDLNLVVLLAKCRTAREAWQTLESKFPIKGEGEGEGEGEGVFVVECGDPKISEGEGTFMLKCGAPEIRESEAMVGNKEAARLLVSRMDDLCYIPNRLGDFPIQSAAYCAQRVTLSYLIDKTRNNMNPNPYAGIPGLKLLIYAIDAEFFDIACKLVENNPTLATMKLPDGTSALVRLIGRSVLSNQRHLSFREHSVSSLFEILNMLWKWIKLVPCKRITRKKSRFNNEAIELVNLLCTNIILLGNFENIGGIYEPAIMKAAELDIRDAVEAMLNIYPLAIHSLKHSTNKFLIFHTAVENRSKDVFNLIYQMSDYKYLLSNQIDGKKNNILHLAGKLAPSHKLEEISGAALQMQRELQWFKEVEKLVLPAVREQRNDEGKTPKALFTEQHKDLKEDGEKWMKDTANSCTISSALIATIMFAAAITVPGGNQTDKGYPIYLKEAAFIIFIISDAISLFTSTTSLLLFSSIWISRYTEEDFLRVLPRRMILGLATLFLSITSMIVSFSATLYLVMKQSIDRERWVLFPVLVLACLPVTSFVVLQFPLLVDLIKSTYAP